VGPRAGLNVSDNIKISASTRNRTQTPRFPRPWLQNPLLAISFMSLASIITNNSVALVRERTIPTERPPIVSEVSANFYG
jgi:hypothetical protein